MKRVLKKIALPMLLLSLLLLTACGGHQEQETTTAVGEHTHQYIAEDFPATCRTQGYTLHVCLDCKDTYTDNIIPVLPHTYTDEVVAPTCIAEGFTRHTCSACGDSYTDTPVEKQPHIWGETVIAPTCTAAGYTEHTCHFCHESYQDTPTAALGHYYIPQIIPATGTEQGYTLHTCLRCEDSYRDSYTDPVNRTVMVQFDANGGIMPEEPRVVYPFETGKEAILPVPTKEGCIFVGWYLQNEEESTLVSDGIWAYAHDIRVRAEWEPIRVEYDLKIGEGGASVSYASRVLTWGSAVGRLPEATPLFGYIFDGYYDGDTRITSSTVSYYTEKFTMEIRFLPPLQKGVVAGENGNDYEWALCADGILRFRSTVEKNAKGKAPTISIAAEAFRGIEELRGVEFPSNLVDIGRYAFAECTALTEVTIPGSVTAIRSSVFEGCTALTNVTFKEGVYVLNERSFAGCSSLTTLNIPLSLLQMYSPFDGCDALRQIYYAGSDFQWSVIVKDPDALSFLSRAEIEIFYQ